MISPTRRKFLQNVFTKYMQLTVTLLCILVHRAAGSLCQSGGWWFGAVPLHRHSEEHTGPQMEPALWSVSQPCWISSGSLVNLLMRYCLFLLETPLRFFHLRPVFHQLTGSHWLARLRHQLWCTPWLAHFLFNYDPFPDWLITLSFMEMDVGSYRSRPIQPTEAEVNRMVSSPVILGQTITLKLDEHDEWAWL